MSMANKRAAEILRSFLSLERLARGNGKSTLALQWAEAILKAIAALEQKEPRPVIVKGRIFVRRYCPACHERMRKDGRFCHACGQAYRERGLFKPIPASNPGLCGFRPGIVIIDELHDWKK